MLHLLFLSFRCGGAGPGQEVHLRRLPLRLRQDKPRHDAPQAARLQGEAASCHLCSDWLPGYEVRRSRLLLSDWLPGIELKVLSFGWPVGFIVFQLSEFTLTLLVFGSDCLPNFNVRVLVSSLFHFVCHHSCNL